MPFLASLESQPRLALSAGFAAWKALLLAVALGSAVAPDYDTSTSLFFERVYGPDADVPALASRLTRWDALYFVHAARHGYVYEQEWAFGTGLAVFIDQLVKLARFLGAGADLVAEPVVAIAIAHASHFIAVLALYQLALVLTKDRKLAFITSALHIISPGGLFMSAPNAESPFACLSFIGNLLFALSLDRHAGVVKRDLAQIAAGIIFGLSSTFRTNGLLSGLLFAVEAVTCLLAFTQRPGLSRLQRLIAPIVGGLCVAAGTIVPQFVAWQRYCDSGLGELGPRPWCSHLVPSIYSFVQAHYWNVGFLKYWTTGQIPLFLLAAPMLTVLIKSGVEVMQKPAGVFVTAQPYHTFVRTLAAGQTVLAVLAITSYHVQIINRISSAYPVWYMWLAGCLRDRQKQSESRGFIVFMVLYAGVQGGLYASFLPPA